MLFKLPKVRCASIKKRAGGGANTPSASASAPIIEILEASDLHLLSKPVLPLVTVPVGAEQACAARQPGRHSACTRGVYALFQTFLRVRVLHACLASVSCMRVLHACLAAVSCIRVLHACLD